jgi:hypothetical protein
MGDRARDPVALLQKHPVLITESRDELFRSGQIPSQEAKVLARQLEAFVKACQRFGCEGWLGRPEAASGTPRRDAGAVVKAVTRRRQRSEERNIENG